MLHILFFISAFLCFTLLAAGILLIMYKQEIVLQRRVHTYFGNRGEEKEAPELEVVEKKKKWLFRFSPYWEKSVKQISHKISMGERKKIDKALREAGYAARFSADEFRLLQLVLSIGGGFFVFMLFLPIADKKEMAWLLAAGIALLGFRYPMFYLSKQKTKRVKEIDRAMPDFFDTVTLLVEAGLGLDTAIATVCKKKNGPLNEEFIRTLEEMKLGKSRREAFYELRKRVPSDAFQSMIASIIQADHLGIGMAKVLRNVTTRIREQRREAAREQAMKAPVKMLFPMLFFIFPALFIVILGPLVIRLVTNGLGG